MNDWPAYAQLGVLTLAAARLTILATSDRITRPLRWPVQRRWGVESYAGYLTWCPWCAGWWVSLTLVLAWLLWPVGTATFGLPWALSLVASWLANQAGGSDKLPAPQPGPDDYYPSAGPGWVEP